MIIRLFRLGWGHWREFALEPFALESERSEMIIKREAFI